MNMAEVRVDDHAPDITLVNLDRQPVRLPTLFGQPLVLAFFPGAFTGMCTREACTFRDGLNAFEEAGGRIIGISVDSPFAQKAWAEQHGLTFTLLSDFNRQAVKAFGVEDPNFTKGLLPGVAKRSVFVLDRDGKITYRWVSDDPTVEPNYDEVQQAVRKTKAAARM
jgi:peroxiredoxin